MQYFPLLKRNKHTLLYDPVPVVSLDKHDLLFKMYQMQSKDKVCSQKKKSRIMWIKSLYVFWIVYILVRLIRVCNSAKH